MREVVVLQLYFTGMQRAVPVGRLAASAASFKFIGTASEKRHACAWAGGGHVSPSRELWSNFGCCAVTQSPKPASKEKHALGRTCPERGARWPRCTRMSRLPIDQTRRDFSFSCLPSSAAQAVRPVCAPQASPSSHPIGGGSR